MLAIHWRSIQAGPPRTSPIDPVAQLGSGQFGSKLRRFCRYYRFYRSITLLESMADLLVPAISSITCKFSPLPFGSIW